MSPDIAAKTSESVTEKLGTPSSCEDLSLPDDPSADGAIAKPVTWSVGHVRAPAVIRTDVPMGAPG